MNEYLLILQLHSRISKKMFEPTLLEIEAQFNSPIHIQSKFILFKCYKWFFVHFVLLLSLYVQFIVWFSISRLILNKCFFASCYFCLMHSFLDSFTVEKRYHFIFVFFLLAHTLHFHALIHWWENRTHTHIAKKEHLKLQQITFSIRQYEHFSDFAHKTELDFRIAKERKKTHIQANT